MNLRPFEDRIIVRREEREAATHSGLILVENNVEAPSRGHIIAVGEEVKGLSTGELVLFSKYGGTEIDFEGETMLVLKKDDVLAVVD